jgi:hypothetical protein
MQQPDVDDRFFPLVVNTLPERIRPEDLPQFFAKSERVLQRREPYVTISDVRATKEIPNATVRKALADWSKQIEPLMKQYTVGSAIVITSPLVRGGLTALFWLAPPPYPQQVVGAMGEAVAAVSRYYTGSGRPLPDGFATYAALLSDQDRRAAS